MINEQHAQRCFNITIIDMCTNIFIAAQPLCECSIASSDHFMGNIWYHFRGIVLIFMRLMEYDHTIPMESASHPSLLRRDDPSIYGQRNFLAYQRCHCYTTERVIGRPSQTCDAIFDNKLWSYIRQMQSFMSGMFLSFSSELKRHVHIYRFLGWVGLLSGVPQQKLGWQFTGGC